MFGFNCRVTRKLCGYERRAVEGLLERSGLVFEGSPDYTAVAEDCDENIVATIRGGRRRGSLARSSRR